MCSDNDKLSAMDKLEDKIRSSKYFEYVRTMGEHSIEVWIKSKYIDNDYDLKTPPSLKAKMLLITWVKEFERCLKLKTEKNIFIINLRSRKKW